MKQLILSLALAAAALLPMTTARAAVIGVYGYDYSATGNRDAQGRTQDATGVRITDNGTTFRDSFDFSGLAGATINSLSLTFTFDQAGPSIFSFVPGVGFGFLERWNVTVEGANPGGTEDDLFATLVDDRSPWTGAIDATTGPGSTFFDDAVANLGFDFRFDHVGLGPGNSFRLAGVSLTVNGTAAVVPLPAPFFLLLTALGGLFVARHRALVRVAAVSRDPRP